MCNRQLAVALPPCCPATQVAPLDRWLYGHVARRFDARVRQEGPAFAEQLAAFRAASVGVWAGGAPSLPRCRFSRRPAGAHPSGRWAPPDFESHPCTPTLQAVGEAAWRDRGFLRPSAPASARSKRDGLTSPAREEGRRSGAQLRLEAGIFPAS